MNLMVGPSPNIRGTVRIPPNKSHSFRALIMAGLAEGTSRIVAPAVSNDWMRGVEAFEMFGAEITPKAGDVWEITGTGGDLRTPDDIMDCGNSGIILRFFAALAARCPGYTVLTGDHSLRHIRLCQAMIDALNQLGAWAVSSKGDGHAPVVVRGMLGGGAAEIDGMDSQPVSALLIASALAEKPTTLTVRRPGEKPWVAMTLDWLARCGVKVGNEGFERYHIPGGSRWGALELQIPLDWSAAMYPIVAALVTSDSEVTIPGMDLGDCQGDKAVLGILSDMGARLEATERGIVVRSSQLTGREIDCNDFIDQLPLLALVGACAQGQTVLTNAESCRHKECDRISETVAALKAMGADIEERPDGLVVAKSRLHGAKLASRSDHRMVLTLAVAALVAGGQTLITDIDCIKKTFPAFVAEMESIGCDMRKD